MLLMNNQTIDEHETEMKSIIALDSLDDVKDIIDAHEFSNDEKVHLIESRFIMEKAEMKRADEKIENLGAIEAFLKEMLGGAETRCADCNCEKAEAPDGQLTIFEFLSEDSGSWESGDPFGEEKSAEEKKAEKIVVNGLDELPDELREVMQGLTGALQTVFGK